MYVYRISQTKYANSLFAPGIYGRWNSEGQRMIYTAGSVALACLENVVHRSGAALAAGDFSIATIEIGADLKINKITPKELVALAPEWHLVSNYHITQKLGDDWLAEQTSPVLKIPSAIIEQEYNYLLNPLHCDFSQINIVNISSFKFDPRLKTNP